VAAAPAAPTAPEPPEAGAAPRPRTLRLSVLLWVTACLAGLAGIGAALADGEALRHRLTDTARALEPAASAAAVNDAVRTTILLVVGGVVVVCLVTVLWTVLVHQRRAWARWPLLVTGLLTLLSVDLAQSAVAGGNDLDRVLLVAQACLVVVALVLLFTRSSRRWLRRLDD
jgi:hypothetical protein